MSRGLRGNGMTPAVVRALESAGEALKPQIAHCHRCSAAVEFEFNAIGQMVEVCQNGHARLYRGAPMVTKAKRIAESGATLDGEINARGTGPRERKRSS